MRGIKFKVISLTLGTGAGVLLIIISITLFSIYSYSTRLLSLNKDAIFDDYDKSIKDLVDSAVSLIDSVHSYQKANNLTDTEGKKLAGDLVRGLKYGKSGYFWIDDYEGINICFPGHPEDEGKSRISSKDQNGTLFIKEIIEKGRMPGGGFTDYWFPKPGEVKADRKRSYSRSFE